MPQCHTRRRENPHSPRMITGPARCACRPTNTGKQLPCQTAWKLCDYRFFLAFFIGLDGALAAASPSHYVKLLSAGPHRNGDVYLNQLNSKTLTGVAEYRQ